MPRKKWVWFNVLEKTNHKYNIAKACHKYITGEALKTGLVFTPEH